MGPSLVGGGLGPRLAVRGSVRWGVVESVAEGEGMYACEGRRGSLHVEQEQTAIGLWFKMMKGGTSPFRNGKGLEKRGTDAEEASVHERKEDFVLQSVLGWRKEGREGSACLQAREAGGGKEEFTKIYKDKQQERKSFTYSVDVWAERRVSIP